MGDHAFAADLGDGAELERLVFRLEGLLRVCKLLEQRGASEAELAEHRHELDRVNRRLAVLLRRAVVDRARRQARPAAA